MSDNIEMGKEYRTRSGKKVRVLCVDRSENDSPVIALVGDSEQIVTFDRYGSRNYSNLLADDLIKVNPRIKRSVFLNVYEKCRISYRCHDSRTAANSCAGSCRIACVELTIDCEHGEGL